MPLTAPRKRIRRVAALTLVIVIGGAAWTFAERSGQTPSVAAQPVTSPAELSRRLPFHPILYAGPGAGVNTIRAEQQLTVSCMKKHGFTYTPAPITVVDEAKAGHRAPFGLESLAPPPEATEAAPAEVPKSEAFTRALYGDPDDLITAEGKQLRVSMPANGCQAEAEKQLLGDQRLRRLQLQLQLSDGEQEARQQLEKDPAFRTATARWRSCMRAVGFDEKDPVSLLTGLPRDINLTTDRAAYADVRCKDQTGYLTTAYTRLGVTQRTWLNRHSDLLADWNRLTHTQDAAARAVLDPR
ncbi:MULTISPECIES: hypothetical protein [unclassified Streptomyces]|uniref:hypothetical protein n=1 Tax=unclassified Streptomyces TaxID=2593676 RepID=UPI002E759ECE|nr:MULTISPECIES: hypothetical protein [unclassified Streptomyces]MEE1759756.1 hypothetical protein [Streptomyces sp. SP18BB07]MEE1829500.1 hypothetical protein [Streptomyces sp. SP17KL33]